MNLINPSPRRSLLMTQFAQKPTSVLEAAKSIDSGLSAQGEAKANQIIDTILDNRQHAATPAQESKEQKEFRLPPVETCGLWNPNFELDASQAAAVPLLASHQYGCLIGAAGTGKTTVQKYLLKELIYNNPDFKLKNLVGKQGINIAMVAFTGMAVQVMKSNLPEWLHSSCKTIHSLLEFAPEEVTNKNGNPSRIFTPCRNSLIKLEHDIIIIDEASMLGLDLWVQLIAACRIGTRIYMTGDLNQLPPIIGQPIFGYTLGGWPVCELTKIHRQKEAGANRIIEIAHEVLNGKMPTFDVSKGNPDWRVLYSELAPEPEKAQKQILSVLNQLRNMPVDANKPELGMIYNPYKDRVMTGGNGYNEDVTSSMVQQSPLNEALSLLIQPPDENHPRYIIDGGRAIKKFAVNLRVMATKNETPDEEMRVTNGMAGIIQDIQPNPRFLGDRGRFGTEEHVLKESRARVAAIKSGADDFEELENANFDVPVSTIQDSEEEKGGGASSHIISVLFDNGANRKFSSKVAVESLQLAFCSTVAKCQGSQFDTAIIICHSADKSQLSREWLYTAITRASKRVIVLGTNYALRYAVNKQRIKGSTLAEKIERYRALSHEGLKMGDMQLKMNVPLRIEDYTGEPLKVNYKLNLGGDE